MSVNVIMKRWMCHLMIILLVKVTLKMKSRHVAGTITKKKKSEFYKLFLSCSIFPFLFSFRDLWKERSKVFFYNSIPFLFLFLFWICRCGGWTNQKYACLAGTPLTTRRWGSSVLWVENTNARCRWIRMHESKRIWCVDSRCFKASFYCCWEEQQK